MGSSVLEFSIYFSLLLLGASIFMVLYRLLKGPSLADRVIAIDLFGTILLSAISLYAILFNDSYYLDVAIVLALFAFLGTVIFGRFIESQGPKK